MDNNNKEDLPSRDVEIAIVKGQLQEVDRKVDRTQEDVEHIRDEIYANGLSDDMTEVKRDVALLVREMDLRSQYGLSVREWIVVGLLGATLLVGIIGWFM